MNGSNLTSLSNGSSAGTIHILVRIGMYMARKTTNPAIHCISFVIVRPGRCTGGSIKKETRRQANKLRHLTVRLSINIKIQSPIDPDTFSIAMSAVTRLTSKLEAKLADHDYYEAHQLYRTIYFRLERDIKHCKPSEDVVSTEDTIAGQPIK